MDASSGTTVYRLGDSGEAVAEIIGKLQRLQLLDDRPRRMFDEDTAVAVRGFQQQRGLVVDGTVGPQLQPADRNPPNSYQTDT